MRVVRWAGTSLIVTLAVVAVLAAATVALGRTLFDMSIGGAAAVYFTVWWTTLFAILPFGVSSQAEAGEVTAGSDPGAPALPALGEKAIWTTIASTAVFAIVGWLLPLAGL
jgi:predicted secreted protein